MSRPFFFPFLYFIKINNFEHESSARARSVLPSGKINVYSCRWYIYSNMFMFMFMYSISRRHLFQMYVIQSFDNVKRLCRSLPFKSLEERLPSVTRCFPASRDIRPAKLPRLRESSRHTKLLSQEHIPIQLLCFQHHLSAGCQIGNVSNTSSLMP